MRGHIKLVSSYHKEVPENFQITKNIELVKFLLQGHTYKFLNDQAL